MNGSTLRVRFMAGTPAEHRRQRAGWWSQVANLKFDFNNAPDAEIRITFDPATAPGPISARIAAASR